MSLINGQQLASEIISELRDEFAKLPQKTVLAAIVLSGNPAGEFFLKQKQKTAQELGIELRVIKIEKQAGQDGLIKAIQELNQDNDVCGIIVQLPLPDDFDSEKIVFSIAPKKDADGFTSTIVKSPAVETVTFLFQKYGLDWQNQKIVVVGKGRLVGEPVYQWLVKEKKDPTSVFAIDKQTSEEKKREWLKQADTIISGAGKANLIASDMVKEGVIAIDFGYDIGDGKICGDISKEVAEKSALFTPTPRGTGPILVAMLFRNLLKLIQAKNVSIRLKNLERE